MKKISGLLLALFLAAAVSAASAELTLETCEDMVST